jgi:cell division protein FtsB
MRVRFSAFGLTPPRLLVIAAVFISIYSGFAVVGNALHQYQLDRENTRLEASIATQRDKVTRLTALRDWMKSDAFVEAAARRMDMVKPGDHAIIVAAPAATPAPVADLDWWKKYLEP